MVILNKERQKGEGSHGNAHTGTNSIQPAERKKQLTRRFLNRS